MGVSAICWTLVSFSNVVAFQQNCAHELSSSLESDQSLSDVLHVNPQVETNRRSS